jgi:Fe-S cluster assembly scaffold protein SufB
LKRSDQNSGIYQLTCKKYNQKYISKTGRTFKTGYNKHINATKSNKSTSKYAQHILDHQHSYGTVHDTMDILSVKKGQHMDTLEKYYIYKKKTCGNILNDTYAEAENTIFEDIHKYTK